MRSFIVENRCQVNFDYYKHRAAIFVSLAAPRVLSLNDQSISCSQSRLPQVNLLSDQPEASDPLFYLACVGPMIFRDRGKRKEYTLWNGMSYFKQKRHFMSPNPLISLFFINFNPYPVHRNICTFWDKRRRGIGSCTWHKSAHLCKWDGACWNQPRTHESQHASYDLMLDQRWLRWLGNYSTINNAVCALMRGWMGQLFFHWRLSY